MKDECTGGIKLLVEYEVLRSALTRLTCCESLLLQSIDRALSDGVSKTHLSALIGVRDLLETISDDFYKEVRACVHAESEERKRRRSIR